MRKLGILVGPLVWVFVAGVVPTNAASPYNFAFVDPKGGTDSITCGAQTQQCLTLNQALANITAGGIVFIQSGAVFGPIYLTDNVSIVGPADQSATINFLPGTHPGCIGPFAGPINDCTGADANYAVEVSATSTTTVKLKNIIINNGFGTNGALKIGNAFGVSL